MTLPTTTLNGTDDDSDMFGPPRSSPVGYHHQRSRVPMISPKLRLREERKRILQLCAHKLERIKDSEANLRRSVCINNTYSRLTDEVRREKQSRYLANLPKSETKPETAHDNIFSPYHSAQSNNYNSMELRADPFHSPHHQSHHNSHHHQRSNSGSSHNPSHLATAKPTIQSATNVSAIDHHDHDQQQHQHQQQNGSLPSSQTCGGGSGGGIGGGGNHHVTSEKSSRSKCTSSSSSVDADLEILDRELSAINASMPLIDPEITQGAEQLEKAVSSRKRSRSEDENDRLVREALSQFYLPTQRLISAIDDCPLDIKRTKLSSGGNGSVVGSINNSNMSCSLGGGFTSAGSYVGSNGLTGSGTGADLDLDLGLDINQSQKEFEVIMDALRLGTSSPTPSASDSCGQAAMMSESGVFHNLVVTSLET